MHRRYERNSLRADGCIDFGAEAISPSRFGESLLCVFAMTASATVQPPSNLVNTINGAVSVSPRPGEPEDLEMAASRRSCHP
jgi:hypothetical protein